MSENTNNQAMVPGAGFGPARLSAEDFKTAPALSPEEIAEYARQDKAYNEAQLPRMLSGLPNTASARVVPDDGTDLGQRAQRGPGERHEQLVSRLVRLGAKVKGFRKAVERAFPDVRGDIEWPHLVPDAYEIDEAEEVVTAHEVVVTAFLTDEKLEAYAWLWFDLDDFGIDLRLMLHRSSGQSEPIDLERIYRMMLAEQAKKVTPEERAKFVAIWEPLFGRMPNAQPEELAVLDSERNGGRG